MKFNFDTRTYFIAFLTIIIISGILIFRGNIIGYFTAKPVESGNVSGNNTQASGPFIGQGEFGNYGVGSVNELAMVEKWKKKYPAEKVKQMENSMKVKKFMDANGIKNVDREVVSKFLDVNENRVIINFKDNKDKSKTEAEQFKLREIGNSMSAKVTADELINILSKNSNEIDNVQVDHTLKTMINDTVGIVKADVAWDSGFTGKGQTVCIVDTGVDYNHENLTGKYLGGYDFVNDDSDPMDDQGHGTHVAGIVVGIAPDAKIVAVKAMDSNGIGYESDIIASIDYCIQNKDLYNISVILLAFGGGSFSGYCDAVSVTSEANYAVSQGVFVVAASGNEGNNAMNAPACGTNVTSAAAVDKSDNLFSRNNINDLTDLLATGVNITSAKLGGGTNAGTGTSASAAVVAGAAAIILEKERLAPPDLQYRFRSTGVVLEHGGLNYSRIDVYNALNNVVTNVPYTQAGSQSEGRWVDYYQTTWECCRPGVDYCGGGCNICFNVGECGDFTGRCCDQGGCACDTSEQCCSENCHLA